MRRGRSLPVGCRLRLFALAVLLCPTLACLNPSIVSGFGGNPVTDVSAGNGVVAVMFVNRVVPPVIRHPTIQTPPTSIPVTVNYTVTRGNGSVETQTVMLGSPNFFAVTYACEIQAIEVTAIQYTTPLIVDANGDGLDDVAAPGTEAVDLETEVRDLSVSGTRFISGLSLQCGDVLLVNVFGQAPDNVVYQAEVF